MKLLKMMILKGDIYGGNQSKWFLMIYGGNQTPHANLDVKRFSKNEK
ncbi:hypothetical protein IC582_029406 [Cucumis melo]